MAGRKQRINRDVLKVICGYTIGTIGFIVGSISIVTLSIYFTTLGKMSFNEFCFVSDNCRTDSNLTCINTKCSCLNKIWNETLLACTSNSRIQFTTNAQTVVTISQLSTTSTPTTTASSTTAATATSTPTTTSTATATTQATTTITATSTSSTSTSSSTSTTTAAANSGAYIVIGYLQLGSYYIKTITDYNNTLLDFAIDIKFVETPTIFLFVLDDYNIIVYDEKARYINQTFKFGSNSLYPIPSGKLFVAQDFGGNYTTFDFSLNQIYEAPIDPTYANSPQTLRYDYTSGYLYEADYTSYYVNALNTSYSRIASESFYKNTAKGSPYVINSLGFFRSAIGNLIYVGASLENKILVIDQATKQLVSEVTNICRKSFFYDMIIDSSGYLFIPCTQESTIHIFFTNGTYHYDTGLFITTQQQPRSITLDSLGRLAVSMFRQIDIYTPSGYTY